MSHDGHITTQMPGSLGAAYRIVGPPPTARANRPFLLRVVVRNTGAAPWPCHGATDRPVNLSYHWLDAGGQVVDYDGTRTILAAPLAPGESAELTLAVEPPPGPGAYQMALDLVEEHVGWFSDRGVPTMMLPVGVGPPIPLDAPRVCIVGPLCLANDAVGNHMLNQLRFFQERGYQAMALVQHIDLRQPAQLRQHMAGLSFEDLRDGRITAITRRALAFFPLADIYVFHYPLAYPLFEALTLVERGAVIVDYHGVTPPALLDREAYERFIREQRQLDLVRYADYAIAHSEFTRDELLRTGAVAPERVYQMAYAVPLERFRPGPQPEALLARYGLVPDQPLLLYVGRMAANKRVADLVRALPLIRAWLPDAALLLVGDDRSPPYIPVVAEAKQLARELGVAEAVIFAGMVPDEELVAHYQLADVFVTASVHEGFCIPVLEAMACGLPVVGAHATALPETIGEGGLTFRPQDPHDLAAKVIEVLGPRAESREPLPDKMTR